MEAGVMIAAERHSCKHICPLIDYVSEKIFFHHPLSFKNLDIG